MRVKMRITKRQLRRIIKEEKAKLMREALDPVLDSDKVAMIEKELMGYALNMALQGNNDVVANLMMATGLSGDDMIQALVSIAREDRADPGLIARFEEDNMGLY